MQPGRLLPRSSPTNRTAARPSLPRAVLIACLALAVPPLASHAQTPAAQAPAMRFDIPGGTLDQVLNRFAMQAGVPLAIDGSLTAGKTSTGLSGSYTVEQGFEELLRGHDLQAVRQGNGNHVLRRAPVTVPDSALAPVVTTASAILDPTTERTNSYTSPAVTIGKSAQSLREIPQSVSVLTRQRMDDQGMTLIETALDQITGIQLDTTTGIGSANLYSRGFLVNSYQYDGVPQTFLGTSYTGFDLAVMDRIEVIRGASGLLQGTGNASATVNLVRKKPTRDLAIAGSLSAGSWDARRGELDVGGPLNESGTVRGRFVTALEDTDSFVDYVGSEKSVLYGVLEADLGERTTATLGAYQQRVNATPSIFGLPRYSDGSSLGLDRSTNLTPAWNWWSQDIQEVFANLTHKLGNEWQFNASALYSTQTQDFKRSVTRGTAANFGVIPGSTVANIYTGIRWNSESDRSNFDFNFNGPATLFGRKHELLVGANSLRSDLTSKQSAIFPAVLIPDLFNFDPGSVPEPADGPYISSTITEIEQQGVYASGRFSVADPLKLIAGVRLSWYETRSDTVNLLTGVTTRGREVSYDGEVTLHGGVIYDIDRSYSLYASYADIFTPQTTQFTRDGDMLDPLVGANYETGIKGEFLDGDVNASLALFRIDQKNRALEDPSRPCAGVPNAGWCYVAAGKVRSQGVELEVSGRVTARVNLFAGYTYNETEYLEDNTNAGQPFRTQTPRHLFKLWTQYRLPFDADRWSLGGGVNAQSGYYATGGGVRSEQEAYAIFKLSASYQFDPKASLHLVVNNVFDKTYYSGIRGVDFGNVYGDPRNFMLTLRMRY